LLACLLAGAVTSSRSKGPFAVIKSAKSTADQLLPSHVFERLGYKIEQGCTRNSCIRNRRRGGTVVCARWRIEVVETRKWAWAWNRRDVAPATRN